MSDKNGGPAFPRAELDYNAAPGRSLGDYELRAPSNGMTLRDYFAAKAMQGLMADSRICAKPEEFAQRSYAMADAMLKARQ